jgi:branched-chain amino acid transport system substrate-binding protein
MKKLWGILIICFLIGLIAFTVFHGDTKKTVTLGVISNFEGKNNQSAIDALRSIKLAYEEFKRLYPESFNLEILPVDDSWNAKKIILAYDSLKEKSDFIIFMTSSTAFLALYNEVLKHPHILHLLAGATNSAISDKDDNVIRNAIDDRLEQQNIAAFLKKRKINEILVLQDNAKNVGYNGAAYKSFAKNFDGQISHRTFSALTMDLAVPLLTFEKGDFKAVYIIAGASPREEGIIIQHLRDIDPDVLVITTPWNKGTIFLEALGKNKENVIIPTYLNTFNTQYQSFIKGFRAKYQSVPGNDIGPMLCYDLTRILLKALHDCGTNDMRLVKQCILSKQHDATTGTIRFNRYGDLVGELYYYRIAGGKTEYLE